MEETRSDIKIINNNDDNGLNELEKGKKEIANYNNKLEEEIKELKKMFTDLQNNNIKKDEEIKELKNDNNKMNKELDEMKKDIKNLKLMLAFMQIRDFAKNFMNQFLYLLNDKNKNDININKKEKWKIIRERVEENFHEYKKSPKYNSLIEIMKKSEMIINRNKKEANNNNYVFDENKIHEIVERERLIDPNFNKLFFLLSLGVSKESFMNGYNFLCKYFDDNMERNFLKDFSIEDFFK